MHPSITRYPRVRLKMTLKDAARILAECGIENALHEARVIFSEIGGIPTYELVSQSILCDVPAVNDAIARRAKREPLQYIIGEVDFYKEKYTVSEDCLIPRPDTEILVDYAVKHIPEGARFLDLCTGSGCVAISVLSNTENTTALGVDISDKALEIARKNAERNKVGNRLELLLADVKEWEAGGEYFAVLSNPPYVTPTAYESLEPEIYREPKIAFLGGDDGCDFYRAITEKYKNKISKNGFIAYEIGYDEEEKIKKIAAEHGMCTEIIKDYSGNPRTAVLKLI